ncbi:TetR/AcrR family transcriptional regulator [Nocardia higoensis]|uniref:TetR/AcrR family transcriptional regulator n=1 Tax=Nocardia higoensis TaxID=228599 RepID=A0ABS0DGP1_9NOCA|nr:TetR/AcrR family transcriptional regulator [Nocardia higoensis]MBF6357601.1 TetR/AcrR family transcriptional regulator [Nocardia higoensis]
MTISAGRQYGGRAVAERKAERRARFLDAATRLFAEHGYADCSLAEVCAAAGLSKRQFYEEFETREDVLVAAYDRVQDEAAAAVVAALVGIGDEADRRDAMTAVLTAYLGAIGADPWRAKLAFVEVVGVSERMERHRRQRRRGWGVMLETAVVPRIVADGRVRGTPGLAAIALIGAINAVTGEWLLSDPRPPIADLVELLVPVAASLIENP